MPATRSSSSEKALGEKIPAPFVSCRYGLYLVTHRGAGAERDAKEVPDHEEDEPADQLGHRVMDELLRLDYAEVWPVRGPGGTDTGFRGLWAWYRACCCVER